MSGNIVRDATGVDAVLTSSGSFLMHRFENVQMVLLTGFALADDESRPHWHINKLAH